MWTIAYASATVPSGKYDGDDAIAADTTTRLMLSDDVKLTWAEVEARFTDAVATRRYLK